MKCFLESDLGINVNKSLIVTVRVRNRRNVLTTEQILSSLYIDKSVQGECTEMFHRQSKFQSIINNSGINQPPINILLTHIVDSSSSDVDHDRLLLTHDLAEALDGRVAAAE